MSEEETRIPTSLYVDTHLAQLTAQGIPYYILNKGPDSSGIVLLKLFASGRSCQLLIQQRDLDGKMGWMHALCKEEVVEREADAYITRAISRDPDLWVIEIEDAAMRNPFEGKIF